MLVLLFVFVMFQVVGKDSLVSYVLFAEISKSPIRLAYFGKKVLKGLMTEFIVTKKLQKNG